MEMDKDTASLAPVLVRIDALLCERERVFVAIEGGSACGKTTAAKAISELYSCTVIHTDDFFLPPELRFAERFDEAGGNFHYERFKTEVTDRLRLNKPFSYNVFDCHRMDYSGKAKVLPERLTIVEGSYSMHPYTGFEYDLSVFLTVDSNEQRRRIEKRNGEAMLHRFVDEWIPYENKYFEKYRIADRCDMIIDIS